MSYHVKRSDREIKDKHELISILERGKYAVIGLASGNEPYVVTLSYGYDKDSEALFFHCGKEGQKIDFIKANPCACATVIDDNGFDADSCDHSYRSVVIRGKIRFINDMNEVDRAVKLLISQIEKSNASRFLDRLKQQNKNYNGMQVLKLSIESITGKAKEKKIQPIE